MLKKQYKLFLALFVLLTVIGGIWAKNHYYSYNTRNVGSRQFALADSSDEQTQIPMDFSFSGGDAILTLCDQYSPDEVNILYFYGDGATTGSVSAADFVYTDDMSGTIMAVAPETQMDIDGDGTEETVLACAKSQTTNSQSYAEYAWINHCFGSEQIPVEIAYYGSGTSSTYMDLLVNGVPYTGMIHIRSNSGMDTDMEITDGALAGLSIKEIRKGFTVTIRDAENDRVLVGSYIAEDYPLFGSTALDNFLNLTLMFVLIVIGTVIICFVRGKVRERAQMRPEQSF